MRIAVRAHTLPGRLHAHWDPTVGLRAVTPVLMEPTTFAVRVGVQCLRVLVGYQALNGAFAGMLPASAIELTLRVRGVV